MQTYPQIWKDLECNTHYRFVSADQPEATELLNASLFSVLNAAKPKTAVHVVDGVVSWECDWKNPDDASIDAWSFVNNCTILNKNDIDVYSVK